MVCVTLVFSFKYGVLDGWVFGNFRRFAVANAACSRFLVSYMQLQLRGRCISAGECVYGMILVIVGVFAWRIVLVFE